MVRGDPTHGVEPPGSLRSGARVGHAVLTPSPSQAADRGCMKGETQTSSKSEAHVDTKRGTYHR